ncbi:elongation factor EF-2 [Candidatus Woesearchaeota archaeon]|nr:elongation factor EF-2 [Candidatus Woesearchaeota archaeon]
MAKTTTDKVMELMKQPKQIRNIGIAAHIDHGKTTLSDSLLAGAGMISEELAGSQLYLDFDEQESARGITINAANVNMIHDVEGNEFLINLIDTPGHVDFGGDVTRAMRAVDGAVVVACAVEGVMPQTETVVRQALKEGVKPILFINKVDRMIKELKLSPEKMQERFVKIIDEINELISSIAPKEFKEKWKVNVKDGSVAFGSAYHKWAVSIPMMSKKKITFKDIIDTYNTEEEWKKLCGKIPLHEAVLDMVVKHIPNPVIAQEYRIPRIWHGDLDSDVGKSLINCDPNGPLVFIVTKVTVDPQAGEMFTGRLFSGKLKKGDEVFLSKTKRKERLQQVYIYKGPKRILIDEALSGNIVGVVGLKSASSGETVSKEEITPFEEIKHLFDPVVTKAIEAKNPQDLPKLIEALKEIAREDPTVAIEINEETGENLISGLGELHLEIWEHRIKKDKGLNIVTSPPIVVFRETIKQKAGPIMGKSPNKHNKLFVTVEPLEKKVYKAIKAGDIPEMRIKKKKKEIEELLVEHGLDKDEARRVKDIYKGNILIDATRGIVHIGEIIEMVMEAFEEVSRAGPVAREPCYGIKVKLTDAKLHEDSIHRGPAQIIPSMRQAIFNAMLTGGDILYEPVQTIRIDAPFECMGAITKLVSGRRGQLIDTEQKDKQITIKAKLPVAEMFGFTSALRSATAGRGAWFLVDQIYEKMPASLQIETIKSIRKRKGLKEDIPQPQLE